LLASNGPEETSYEIADIRTEGNRIISSNEILSKVYSRVGELFDEDKANDDARRIAGLSGVRSCSWSIGEPVDNKIILTFAVEELEIVRSIDFVGNRRVKEKTLRGMLGFKEGDHLDAILAEAGRRVIADYYLKQGYAVSQVALDTGQLSVGKVVYIIEEGPRVKIAKVAFSGNDAIKTGKLKKAVKTKEKKWFFWPSYFTEEKVSEDISRLQRFYYDRSFLDVAVTVKREFNEDRSEAYITFVINEGQIYTIEGIDITGNEYFDGATLRAELKLKEGQSYSERKAKLDGERLVTFYREQGFVDVKVEKKRSFVAKGNVRVGFEISEGELFRIGRVDITGNKQTQDKVIRRILDEYDFQPGKMYNADIARGDGSGYLEKTVRQTILAQSATITPVDAVPGQKNAQVSITESETGWWNWGAGVTADMGFIGQMIFEQRNFDISDWPESFEELMSVFGLPPPPKAFYGAGQQLRIALQPGTEVSEYSISFRDPYYKDKPTALDVIGSSWERFRESYDEGRLRGYVGFEHRYKNRWRRGIRLRFESVEVDDLDNDAPQEIIDVEGDNMLAGVRLSFGKDVTDDIYNPGKGYNFNVSYEQVGGDHTFGILSGTHRWYKTLYEDLDGQRTILGTKFAAATALGDAPPFERFYAGGTGTYGIRGFDYRGVSTRGLQTNVANPERDDPIGSDWIFLANAELTSPLVGEEFAALFFIDSGIIDTGGYRVSVGTGIQIMIPHWFGPMPMRFEIATPIMRDDADETRVFSFSIGRMF
jgi:outer membrane protein assembly factor BamA